MNITTYTVEEYKKCPIYFRSWKNHFEYLTIIKKELYTAHFTIFPTFINKLLYLFKLQKSYYSQQQIKAVLKRLRDMAETTIDYITEDSKIER